MRRMIGLLAPAVMLLALPWQQGDEAQSVTALVPSEASLEEVLARMDAMEKARVAALRNYSSLRRYRLENHRFGTKAEIRARMNFQHPGTKTVEILSEQGSGIIRKRVLGRLIKEEVDAAREDVRTATRIDPDNYTFRLEGTQEQQGRRCYVLEAVPKRRHKHLLRGRIWVDLEDAAIVRIEGAPAQKPSFLIRKTSFVHTYEKFGQFWLPVSNHSTSDVLIYGRAEVTVEYSDYRVNDDRASGSPASTRPLIDPTAPGTIVTPGR